MKETQLRNSEKFLLFAMWYLTVLVVFLEDLLSQGMLLLLYLVPNHQHISAAMKSSLREKLETIPRIGAI